MTPVELELLELTRGLVEAIHAGDIDTYREFSLPELTCFETDVAPYRIDGVDFHVDLMAAMRDEQAYRGLVRFDLLEPSVRVYGDTAVVAYTRLMTWAEEGSARFTAFNETRVFVRREGGWRMAHFHRSHAAV